MFEGLKTAALSWAVKQQLRADKTFFEVLLDRKPKWTNWTTENAVREGYKASVWVYASINKKAKAIASVPWYVYKQDRNGDWIKQENHPLQLLIDRPNPFTTRANMIEKMVIQLDLAGNTLMQKIIAGGIPVELWSIGPDFITPVPDQQEFIKSYEIKMKNSRKINIPAADMIHVMYMDPANPFWGIAPLQVAARTVDTDIEATNWNKIALQNRAVTDGVFTVNNNLTTPQFNDLRAQIREQHQGAANARTPWILGGGAQWQQMSLSPADMDFIEGRKLTREEIAAIFQVPPPIIGILDKANYSNMQEARRVFWLDTNIPILNDLRDTFNRTLTPHFGADLFLDYDLTNVEALQENVNEKIEAAVKLWGMGVPFNEVNRRLDLGIEEVPGGDMGYLPASLLPANMAASIAAAGAGDQQQEDGEKSIKKPRGGFKLKGYNLQTPEQKAAYWKSFERQRARWYSKMNAAALDMFSQEAKAVAAAFAKNGDMAAALAAVDKKAWEEFYVKYYIAIMEDFGKETYEGFKSHIPKHSKEWDPWDSLILGRIFKAAARKVTMVTDYTKELIKGIVYTGRDNGDSIATIARDLKTNFDQFGTVRAFRIARTEVVSASNFGSYQAAQQAAEEVGDLEKEWIDSGDERVRDKHEKVNGERVGLYKKFSNGLEHPGDMSGPADEVINCRCTTIYHPIAYR